MIFTWTYAGDESLMLKTFLQRQGVSRNLLAKIKFQGGRLTVNGQAQNVRFILFSGDQVQVELPPEGEHETVLRDNSPLEIVYEDAHYLIVNKPTNVASIPAQYHPNGTMANRVKNYYCERGYQNRVVHIVTRLDRDTTGLMLFAKHSFAHGLLAKEMQKKAMIKKYQAIVAGQLSNLSTHGYIEGAISRAPDSIIKRQVSETGLAAKTEYWQEKQTEDGQAALVTMQLHTGRTHQIRVHFASLACPLIGDELYGGRLDLGIERQALHCKYLSFYHPFQQEYLTVHSHLPTDMQRVASQLNLMGGEE